MIAILEECVATGVVTQGELLKVTGFSKRTGGFQRQLEGLLKMELLEMTIPDKPTSPSQKYRITEKGKAVLDELGKLEEQSE